MIQELSLRLTPRDAATPSARLEHAARALAVAPARIQHLQIVKRGIDARQRHIFVNLTLRAFVDEPAPSAEFEPIVYPNVEGRPAVVVVGAGPGGLFAALRLIERGLRPIVIERGKDVHSRRRDIARISRDHLVDPESNYSFGEGGAGAYSDGKLYTRSTKRGDVDRILRIFCQHGASTDILCDAHPHIGTDRLPAVIEAMRNTILRSGGEVRFQTCVNGLLLNARREAVGVTTTSGQTVEGPVILATGHSARDVFRFLHRLAIPLETKGIAIGVRLEHSAQAIDRIMYHNPSGRGAYLPAAEYRMTAQSLGRGVYSFCMCPGGFVVPAASAPGQLVVNGMSPSGRNGRWSNSGMVVQTMPDDLADPSLHAFLTRRDAGCPDETLAQIEREGLDNHPLRMMFLQEALEHRCWQEARQTQSAPSQRMTDFMTSRQSTSLPRSSYSAGLTSSPLHAWIPSFITTRLREGFDMFGRRYRGFLSAEALMLAIETRTSSPVRIVRHPLSLAHVAVPGLYPCGEGAGYAGGIVSAAIDGERCADAAADMML